MISGLNQLLFLDCFGRLYLFFAGPLWKAWTSRGRHIRKVCFFFFDISEEKGKTSYSLHPPGWPTKLTRWKLWQGKTSQISSGGNIFLFVPNHEVFPNFTNSDCLWSSFFVAAVAVLVCSSTSLPHGALHVCPCCQSSEKRAHSLEGRSPLAPWVLQIRWWSSSYNTFPFTRVSQLVMGKVLSDSVSSGGGGGNSQKL